MKTLRLAWDLTKQIPSFIAESLERYVESVRLAPHRPVDVPMRGRIAEWEMELLGIEDPAAALMGWCPRCDEPWVCAEWRRIKEVE